MSEAPAAITRPVLVLYAPADESFVRGFLLPALGPTARGEPVVDPTGSAPPDRAAPIDARDLASVAIDELDRVLHASGVTIAVITPAFLANRWARLAELIASSAAVDGELDVIPLVLEDCALPLHIRAKVRLDFRSREDWDREAKHLRDYLARPPPIEAALPCPYPGMRPFEAADARYFHGRGAEIDAVLALVAAGEREIYLVGPSGSGKSSLIAAGVLPRLAAVAGAELIARAMRPGDAPVRRLADCLEAGPAEPDAAAVTAWSARHAGARLLVFVDQLEELFTQDPAAEQARFAAGLGALRAEPRCVLVLALRADFYAELLDSQLWLDGGRRHVDLPSIRGAALRQAIELPARALDVYFEPGLIERLVADAAGEPGVLPLLQETLVQLWGRRRQRLLTLAAYEALGEGGRSGLAVAISSRADRCLGEMTPGQAVIARRLLLRLVSFGEGRPNTRRRQTRAQLLAGEPPAALDGVLRQLVAARLVIMDGDERTEDAHVDLCHEVLITAWPSFAAWVAARRADELRRRQIQASADQWIVRGRGASGLLDPGELAAAIAWRRTDAACELGEDPEVTALIAASSAALARARRRWRRGIASVGAGLAVFAAVTATLAVIARGQATVATTERGKAELARRHAVRMLGEQYREAGRQAVVDGQLQRAIPYLVAAREQGVDDAGLRMLFRTASASSVAVSLRHGGSVTAASFSDDGARIVTASRDGTARVWDAASGVAVTPPLVHPGPVTDAMIGAGGTRVLTISGDTAWIWDVTASPPSKLALHHAGRVNAASFGAGDAAVVTASDDQTARVWSVRTGQPVGPPLVHDARVLNATLSRDGSRIVTMVGQGLMAGIWDARTGARIAALRHNVMTDRFELIPTAHQDLVGSAAFSPDGSRIVTTGFDNWALVWDAATGKVVGPRLKHAGVLGATFSPDGKRIATMGDDDRVRIWDVASGTVVGPMLEHPSPLVDVTFSGDGTRLLTESDDKLVRIWDAASGALVAALDLESPTLRAAISRDGTRVVTASFDGFARVWDVGSMAPRVLDIAPRMHGAAYTPDGSRIATTDESGGLRIWTTSGALVASLRLPLGTMDVVFDRDGRRFACIELDGVVQIGDVAAGTAHGVHRTWQEEAEQGWTPDVLVGHPPSPAAFSPDGRRLATTGAERSARIWDTESLEAVTPPLVHPEPVVMIRYSPDGRRVITASRDHLVRVWDAGSGAPLGPALDHPVGTWVSDVEFSPDGTRIATVGTDHAVRLWDAASGRLEAVLTGHAGWIVSATFSPDGALLLTHSSDHSARVWDVATGRLAIPAFEHAGVVESAAFSPDGARVVTASGKLVQVWDIRTGRPLAAPFVHPDYVRTAVFSPDGSAVLTIALDTVRIWRAGLDTGTLEDWHRLAGTGAFPQLQDALHRASSSATAP